MKKRFLLLVSTILLIKSPILAPDEAVHIVKSKVPWGKEYQFKTVKYDSLIKQVNSRRIANALTMVERQQVKWEIWIYPSQTQPTTQEYAEVEDLPPELQLFNSETVKDIPKFWQSALLWPSLKEIEANRFPEAQIKGLKEGTTNFLYKAIQEKWIPKDIEKRLIGVNNHFDGGAVEVEGKAYLLDCFLTRYQIENYMIQIKVLFSSMFLTIKRKDGKRFINPNEQEDFVLQTIKLFLNKSEEIGRIIPSQKLIRYQNSISKIPAPGMPQPGAEDIYWWGSLHWWTDGEIIVLNIVKGGKMAPDAKMSATWFEQWGDPRAASR